MAQKASKTKQRATRKSRQSQRSETEEETDPDFVPAGEDEDMEDEALSETSDADGDKNSEEDEPRGKGRRNSRSTVKGSRGSLPSKATKRLAPAEPSKEQRSESGPDAFEDYDYELDIQVRKVTKKRLQRHNVMEGGPWEKVTLDGLLELLKLKVVPSEGGANGKTLEIEGGKNVRSLQGKGRKRKRRGADVSEPAEAGPRRKSTRLSDVKTLYKDTEQSEDGDDVSAEVAPSVRRKTRAGKKGKGNRFVVGGEARSDEEETGDDDLSNFIADDDEVSEDDAEVSGGEGSSGDEEAKAEEDNDAAEPSDERGPRRRRLQKVRQEEIGLVEHLADDSLGKGASQGLKKSSRIVESEEEDCGGGKAGLEEEKGGVESPDIPLKGGLTTPVQLKIPKAPVEGDHGSESEDDVPVSVRKRRIVSMLEDEDEELAGGAVLGTDAGEVTQVAVVDNTVAGLGKSLETETSDKAAKQDLDRDCRLRESAASRGGTATENVSRSAVETKEGLNGVSAVGNEQVCEEPAEGGRRRCSRKSDVSLLEQMLENRSKVLGLVPPEEEGSEGAGSEDAEDDEDESAAMKAFIEPDEEGNYEGYGGASEKGGSVAGASEGGVSDGEPTGEDEDVVRMRDFEAYLAYVMQTIRDPGVKTSAREDRALMDSVRRCEEALTSRRTQLVESTSWRPTFKAALDSHPGLTCWDTHDHVDCQACGRANHPSTHVMEVGGERCRPSEVWEFDMAVSATSRLHKPGNDDEEENESEKFLVGRFCYARAMVYHGLHHYKWRLIQRLKRALEQAEANSEEEDAIATVLEIPGFVAGLHRNINGFASAAERFRDRTQSGERGLVGVEEITEMGKIFELVEELGEGGLDV